MGSNIYNIALIPISEPLQNSFYQAASLYADKADRYVLTENEVLPHLTLCQYLAADDAAAQNVLAPFTGRNMDLVISKSNYRNGATKHLGKTWVEFCINPNPPLNDLQAEIYNTLAKHGIERLTNTGAAYHPHITLARLGQHPDVMPDDLKNFAFLNKKTEWVLRIGKSDENGQLLQIIK